MPVNTTSGLFDDFDDPPIMYGFIVICSDSAAFGIWEKFEIDFLLFHIVVNIMAVIFRYAFELVGKIVYSLGFVVENYCCETLDYF